MKKGREKKKQLKKQKRKEKAQHKKRTQEILILGSSSSMDLTRILSSLFLVVLSFSPASANGIFKVKHKFAGLGRPLGDFKAHDTHRHGRLLSAINFPLGGISLPSEAGLYFAEIGLGTPSRNYYVQVDTGSDILWVNCIECNKCPQKSGLGIELSLYDIKESSTASLVGCSDPFCTDTYGGHLEGCTPQIMCQYSVTYGDGSTTAGYYVKDSLQYDKVTGNQESTTANASVIFGCGAQQTGDLGSSTDAVDGIFGFGQSNSSVISQLASSGMVKKIFAHCLDTIVGGGIFAIGDVVQPKVRSTPLVPHQQHYNVHLEAILVGGTALQLPSDIFDSGDKKGTIIDSGTTLAYFPEVIYDELMKAIRFYQPNLILARVSEFQCFEYSGSVDDGFPTVTLQFENSVSMSVYPHDYLFQIRETQWCFGWQNSGLQSKDTKDIILLGDMVLANKLVVYDLEKQVIGWTDHNCSSTIKVRDEITGKIYTLSAESISSIACSLEMSFRVLLLLTAMILNLILK